MTVPVVVIVGITPPRFVATLSLLRSTFPAPAVMVSPPVPIVPVENVTFPLEMRFTFEAVKAAVLAVWKKNSPVVSERS